MSIAVIIPPFYEEKSIPHAPKSVMDWAAADTFVAPGLAIGDGAVVGARSGVFKDLEPWKVYMGSPARFVRDRITQTEEGDS